MVCNKPSTVQQPEAAPGSRELPRRIHDLPESASPSESKVAGVAPPQPQSAAVVTEFFSPAPSQSALEL